MSTAAKVHSIDALRHFRGSLWKFHKTALSALGDCESDMRRVLGWLENEQKRHWERQLRARSELVSKAKEALRMKRLFKSPTGSKQSTIDEEKDLAKAQRSLDEAEEKLKAVKMYTRSLQKEILLYQGQVQQFATTVQVDLPMAVHLLNRLVVMLEKYTAQAPPGLSDEIAKLVTTANMARAETQIGEKLIARMIELRKKSPVSADRQAIPDGDIAKVQLTAGPISPKAVAAIARLPKDSKPFDPGEKVAIAHGSWNNPQVYLRRVEPGFQGDSGWYIGPANELAVDSVEMVKAGELLAARPDLNDILQLDRGTLVLFEVDGLSAVIGGKNELIFDATEVDEEGLEEPVVVAPEKE